MFSTYAIYEFKITKNELEKIESKMSIVIDILQEKHLLIYKKRRVTLQFESMSLMLSSCIF